MSKPSTVFKRTTNQLLQYIADHAPAGTILPSESRLATLCLASRTTIHSALAHLRARRVIGAAPRGNAVQRTPRPSDYFDADELRTGMDRVRQVLMERVFQKDMPPGAEFSEAELAREAQTSTVSVREFLIGFARFGLIEKKARGGWRLCAFDPQFGEELADMRQVLELAALGQFEALGHDDPAWTALEALVARHRRLQAKIAARFREFPALDREFHGFLIGVLGNRFAQGFYDIVSFVFHYHYQWDRRDEMQRNTHALTEHLQILEALAARDVAAAQQAMRAHLATSRRTMLRSIRTRDQALERG